MTRPRLLTVFTGGTISMTVLPGATASMTLYPGMLVAVAIAESLDE